jgi:SulP family sulfate permease
MSETDLITVGIGVMDYKGLKAIPVLPRDISLGPIRLSSEVLIMLTVLLLSTFWDLIFAVGIGLLISCLLFMKLIGDSTAKRSNLESLREEAWPDEKSFPVALKNEVYINHIKGPLFFGYTSAFQKMIKKIPNDAKTVVFRLSRMQYMDQTGLYVMEDALQDLKARGVNVIFIGLLDQPRYMMERIKIIPNLVAENQIYKNFKNYLKRLS